MHCCDTYGCSTELEYVPLIPTEIHKYKTLQMANTLIRLSFRHLDTYLATCRDLVRASDFLKLTGLSHSISNELFRLFAFDNRL